MSFLPESSPTMPTSGHAHTHLEVLILILRQLQTPASETEKEKVVLPAPAPPNVKRHTCFPSLPRCLPHHLSRYNDLTTETSAFARGQLVQSPRCTAENWNYTYSITELNHCREQIFSNVTIHLSKHSTTERKSPEGFPTQQQWPWSCVCWAMGSHLCLATNLSFMQERGTIRRRVLRKTI
jgi:hypothetical protein